MESTPREGQLLRGSIDQQCALYELALIIAREDAFAPEVKMGALKPFAVDNALGRRPSGFIAGPARGCGADRLAAPGEVLAWRVAVGALAPAVGMVGASKYLRDGSNAKPASGFQRESVFYVT